MDWPLLKALAVAFVLLFGLVFGTSIIMAPDRGIDNADVGGPTVVGVQGSGVGFHEGGQVAMHDADGNQTWEIENANSYFDVTPLDDGRVLAAFANRTEENCGDYGEVCALTGVRILDPGADDPVVQEYAFRVRTIGNSEVHDVEMLPSGNVAIADMDRERVFVVDMDTEEIHWQWNASAHYEAPEDPTREDWLHINDLDYLGDDRFLVSVRNENQLLLLERGQGVVEVINEDGDGNLFQRQHNPQWLEDGAILIADSENNRVVEIHRNETTGEWEHAWISIRANNIPYNWPRDADRLPNGNTLITDSVGGRVVEVTESGETVWSATMSDNPYEADRVDHRESVGGPTYGTDDTVDDGAGDEIPVLTPVLQVIQHSIPLPHWFSERHVAILIGGIVLGLGGLVSLVRSRLGG